MNQIIIFVAQYFFILVILLLIVSWYYVSKPKRLEYIVTVIVAGIIAFVLSRIASKLYYDPRPFVVEHVKPLFPHLKDNGFPSDHALLTGTLTAVAYIYNKKFASYMLVITILIGTARVLAKVHSPLDITGGWLMGVIGAYLGYKLSVWLIHKYYKGNLKQKADTLIDFLSLDSINKTVK